MLVGQEGPSHRAILFHSRPRRPRIRHRCGLPLLPWQWRELKQQPHGSMVAFALLALVVLDRLRRIQRRPAMVGKRLYQAEQRGRATDGETADQRGQAAAAERH